MAKSISNMGQRAKENLTKLVGSIKELREAAGHLKNEQGQWVDQNGRVVDSLSRFHLAIGAQIDEQDRLVDAQGRLIEGLSDSDIALKRYIDSQGRLRDSQDRLIEGLKASEKAAGMWKDELGNVYDAQNKLVRSVEKANAGIQMNADKAVQAAQGLGHLVATMTIYTGKANPAAKAAVALSAGISAGTMAMQAAQRAGQLVAVAQEILSKRTWAAFTAQMAFNGASGNWVGVAAGAAAAAGAASISYSAMGDAAKDAVGKLDKMGASVKKLQDMANERGKPFFDSVEINRQYAEMNESQSHFVERQLTMLRQYEKERERLHGELKQKQLDAAGWLGFGKQSLAWASLGYFDAPRSELKKFKKETDEYMARSFGGMDVGKMQSFLKGVSDRFKTEAEKLQEEIKSLKAIADSKLPEIGKGAKEEAARLAEKLQKQHDQIGLEEKKKEDKFLADLRAKREDWVTNQIKTTWVESRKVEETLNEAKAMQAAKIKGAAEAVKALEEKYKAAVKKEAIGDLQGTIDKAKEAAMTLAEKETKFLDQLGKLRQLAADGHITQKQLNDSAELLAEEFNKRAAEAHGTTWLNLDETVAKATEAAMTMAEKEAKLADELDIHTQRLRDQFEAGRITQRQLDDARKYLADETQKQVEALGGNDWSKQLKEMFKLRVPMDQRIKEAFSGIEEAGRRLGATADEMAKVKETERERIKKMYGMEEKKEKETKEKSSKDPDGGTFAVAGSVEAYRISATSSQDKTTKAVDNVRTAIETMSRDLGQKIEDSKSPTV